MRCSSSGLHAESESSENSLVFESAHLILQEILLKSYVQQMLNLRTQLHFIMLSSLMFIRESKHKRNSVQVKIYFKAS